MARKLSSVQVQLMATLGLAIIRDFVRTIPAPTIENPCLICKRVFHDAKCPVFNGQELLRLLEDSEVKVAKSS